MFKINQRSEKYMLTVKAPAIVVFIIPAAKFRHNDFVGSAVI